MAVLLWRTAKTKYCCPFGREKEGGIVYRPYMTTGQLAKLTVRKFGHVYVVLIIHRGYFLLPYHIESTR